MSEEGGERTPLDRAGVAWTVACGIGTGVLERLGTLPPALVSGGVTFAVSLALTLRLAALVRAPRASAGDFEYDVRHRRACTRQVMVTAFAWTLFAVLPSIPRTGSMAAVTIKLTVFACLSVAGFILDARVRRYCRDRGGLTAAYGLTTDVEDALEVVAPGNPTADRTIRVVAQCLAAALFVATLTSTAEAHERIAAAAGNNKAQGKQPAEVDTPSSSPSQPPRNNPYADKKCEYNVESRIGEGIPTGVALALARVLINPEQDEDIGAPGVVEAGCPDEGSHRAGALYVTPLFHWDTGIRLGLLVSDDKGNAAVVFSELRAEVEYLIREKRLVRATRRVRTRLGDMQLLFVDGAGCAVAMREYTRAYYVFTGRAVGQLMGLVDARQEVPRLLPPVAGKRTGYAFEFARTRPRAVTVASPTDVTVLDDEARTHVPVTRAACPEPVGFLEVAQEEEPEPESTP